jgi:hypothetical protein
MKSNSNRAGHPNSYTDPDEIGALKRRLTIHRRSLYVLEERRAKYGDLDVPLHIIHEIAEEKENIAQIEARLAGLSVDVPKVDRGTVESRDVREPQSSHKSLIASISKKLWLPSVWWIPIVVALIGLLGVLITSKGRILPTPDTSFGYQVRVQAKDTGRYIPDAKVTIEVSGQAPLDDITDSNGLARISISSSRAGKPGRLIVEAAGYKRYMQNIDLTMGTLPDVVLLERSLGVTPTPTFTPTPHIGPSTAPTLTLTPITTNTSTSTPTFTHTPTRAETPTDTPVFTYTPTQAPIPTAIPTATDTPTLAPTQTLSYTIEFRASKTIVNPGEWVIFRWHVENVHAVYLDWKGGVGAPGEGWDSRQMWETTDHTLRVVLKNGETVTRTITVTVRE